LDAITFNIPGGGLHIIVVLSPLPQINGPVFLDGYTQSGSSPNTLVNGDNAVLAIELNGSSAGSSGLVIQQNGSGSTVRGLIINRFQFQGVLINPASAGNTIEGNFIGTGVAGASALGNLAGLFINGARNNTIGGTALRARNLISGNRGSGIQISNGSTLNVVQGNLIGTDANGTAAVPNGHNGQAAIFIGFSSSNTIGGSAPEERNIVSGNLGIGVLIQDTASSGNSVLGNYIGTDITGNVGLSNVHRGVMLSGASNNTIAGNVLSGNIGSGNDGAGVSIEDGGTGNQVQGNFIGTNANGTTALGNADFGVLIDRSSGNTIATNTIAFNGAGAGGSGAGVIVGTFDPSSNTHGVSVGNAIHQNSIFSNDGLGILLYDGSTFGVTPNDPCDTDTGPNNFQNFPILNAVSSSGGNTTIQGTLNSTPNTAFTIEFFANAAADPSGYGEGQTYIGSTTVTTGPDCNASFVVTFADTPGQPVITATATDPAGNTSEFSGVLTNAADLSITKTDGQTSVVPGSQVTYTITATNNGPSGVTGATVNDNFPASLSSVTWTCTASAGSSCGAATGSGNINTSVNLLTNGTATFTATGTLSRSATGTLDNTATVTPPAGVNDPNTANNSATDSDTITATSDLSLTKTGSPNPVTVGGTLTYTITVNNGGPSTATNVMLTDTLPASVSFASATPSQGSCTHSGGTVNCNLSSIADGGLATVTITVTPNAAGTITNTATVSANESDPNSANNTATATTTVINANTTTTVTSSQNPSTYGQPVTFTATVTAVAPGGGTPTGTVTFYDGTMVLGTGTLNALGQATFTTSSLSIGTHSITAIYNGDANYNGSTSPPVVQLVFAFPRGAGGGDFVIGDLNAAVGNRVTFWGAQWAKSNSLSGGPAPSSFKGFADSTSTNPPTCGGSWSTDPGNSSGPPSSVPAYIAVIVSSSITKSGSMIAGNTRQMVVVKTDPGYASNPGHAGTGTVVAVICQ
jgi:uncharacterized repeat protein (TIGR01451 family)